MHLRIREPKKFQISFDFTVEIRNRPSVLRLRVLDRAACGDHINLFHDLQRPAPIGFASKPGIRFSEFSQLFSPTSSSAVRNSSEALQQLPPDGDPYSKAV